MTARALIQHATLPQYNTSAERIARLDGDIRDLTSRMRATLTQKAHEHVVAGYALDEESWEIGTNGNTIVLSVRVVRPDDV